MLVRSRVNRGGLRHGQIYDLSQDQAMALIAEGGIVSPVLDPSPTAAPAAVEEPETPDREDPPPAAPSVMERVFGLGSEGSD
jgi:hypothetical protein